MRVAALIALLLPMIALADDRPRLDIHGDPLPPGAIVRLGSVRLKHEASAVAFVNSKTLVSAGQSVRTWDLATGKMISEWKSDRLREANRLVLSRNGKILIAAQQGVGYRIWEATSGKHLRDINGRVATRDHLHGDMVYVAVSDDGKRMIACGETASDAYVWSTDSDKEPVKLSIPGQYFLLGVAMAGDGSKVAAILHPEDEDEDKPSILAIWDAANGKVLHRGTTKLGLLTKILFAPDGKTVGLIGDKGLAIQTVDGKEVWRNEVAGYFYASLFAPDGRFIVWVGDDDRDEIAESEVQIHDAITGKITGRWKVPAESLLSVCASPDSKLLATASGNRIRVRNLADGSDVVPIGGHSSAICTTCITPDGKYLASTDFEDRDVFLWEIATGRLVRRFQGHTKGCIEIVLSPDGKQIASSSYDNTVRVWEVATGKQLHKFEGFTSPQWHLRFGAEGKTLAMCPYHGIQISLFDLTTGQKIRDVPLHGSAHPSALLRHPDGRLLLIDSVEDGEDADGVSYIVVQVWDVLAGRMIYRLSGRRERLICSNLSPDGRTLATRGYDGQFRLWEMASGLERATIQEGVSAVQNGTQFFAWSPDGRTIASACVREPKIQLWDVPTGDRIATFPAHSRPMYTVEYTPDGQRLMTGGQDALILGWDMTRPDRRSRPLPMTSLSEAELHLHWEKLHSGSAEEAYRSHWALASDPEATVAFLATRFMPAKSATAEQVKKWIDDLGSPRYPVREQAERHLLAHIDSAASQLDKALQRAPGEEVRSRIRRILDRSKHAATTPGLLRELRAVEVLETIGTESARKVLARLAAANVRQAVASDAAAALKRLESRASR